MPWAALASPCPASPLHQQKHHIQAQAGAMLWLNTKGRGGGRLLRDDVGSHKRDKLAVDRLMLLLGSHTSLLAAEVKCGGWLT